MPHNNPVGAMPQFMHAWVPKIKPAWWYNIASYSLLLAI